MEELIFLSLFEPIEPIESVFVTPNVVSDPCTNNFFNVKFILLNII